jgi:nitrogen regulatory protein P-II 2
MELTQLKCVTIVAESVLKKRLSSLMDSCGATGYTVTNAEGEGSRDQRRGAVHGDNVKIDVVCPPHVCETLMRKLAERYFDKYACVAWVQDVAVVGGGKFQKAPKPEVRWQIVG